MYIEEGRQDLLTVDVSEAATSDEDKEVHVMLDCIEQTHVGVSKTIDSKCTSHRQVLFAVRAVSRMAL